jgi:hypothetical protein
MKKIIKFSVIASILIISSSCHKKDHEHNSEEDEETATAEIFIDSLHEGDTIQNQQNVLFTGYIKGSAELHGYQLTFQRLNPDSTVYTLENSEHKTSYEFNGSWTNTVKDTSHMTATLKVAINHDGATSKKTIHFICLP